MHNKYLAGIAIILIIALSLPKKKIYINPPEEQWYLHKGGNIVRAGQEQVMEDNIGIEKIDVVVEKIMSVNEVEQSQKDLLYKEVTAISDAGIPLDDITADYNDDGELEYNAVFEDGTVESIATDFTVSGDVIYNFKEDDIEDEVKVCENGDVYLDGNLVLYETSSNDDEYSDKLETSVEGVSFSQKAPKQVKSWRSYSTGWKCNNINLHKFLGDMTVGAITTILYNSPAKQVAGVFVSSAVNQIKTADPYSKGICYKIWVANSKVPATSRYVKLKKILYGKKNYKGKASSPVIYYETKG